MLYLHTPAETGLPQPPAGDLSTAATPPGCDCTSTPIISIITLHSSIKVLRPEPLIFRKFSWYVGMLMFFLHLHPNIQEALCLSSFRVLAPALYPMHHERNLNGNPSCLSPRVQQSVDIPNVHVASQPEVFYHSRICYER